MSEKKLTGYEASLLKPFRVSHTNGDVLAGFDDAQSAENDAKERNGRALAFGILARYTAGPKP